MQFEYKTIDGTQTFGPAFRKEFLLEAFRLQQAIENVGSILLD